MSSNNPANAANGLSSDPDLAALAALLRAEESDEHADSNLAEILARLDNADCIARQMESNLDKLLERLDGMLEGLEAAQADQTTKRNEENADLNGQNGLQKE